MQVAPFADKADALAVCKTLNETARAAIAAANGEAS